MEAICADANRYCLRHDRRAGDEKGIYWPNEAISAGHMCTVCAWSGGQWQWDVGYDARCVHGRAHLSLAQGSRQHINLTRCSGLCGAGALKMMRSGI